MAVNKPIQFKRSNVPGKVPTVSQLLVGEIALNTADRVFYTKDAAGAIVKLTPDVAAPLSLTYAKTDAHVLKLSGTADVGDIATIATKKAVLYATAPANATVGTNYAIPKTRVLQDIVMVESDPAVTTIEASDSIRALSVYGIGTSIKKENTAYITTAGSIYGNTLTLGKSKSNGTQHISGSALSINMSKETPQAGAINIEAFSDTNTSRVISINEVTTSVAGQMITVGVAPVSSGLDAADVNSAKFNGTWNTYETPYDFVKLYSHAEDNVMYGITGTGEVYFSGFVSAEGEAGVGLNNAYVGAWKKANVENVEELFLSPRTTFARTFDGKWFGAGIIKASAIGGADAKTNTFVQIFSLPANAQKIYYGYISNGNHFAFVTTKDGTLYVKGMYDEGYMLSGYTNYVPQSSFSNWTIHPNKEFQNPKDIQIGYSSTFLLSAAGDLWVAGYTGNNNDLLGVPADSSNSRLIKPTKVAFPSKVKQILPGYVSGRVVLENGDLYGCGDGQYGFHGLGASSIRTWTKSLEGVDRIYGHRYLLAVKTDGTRWYVGNQALLGNKTKGDVKSWISAPTIPTSATYNVTSTVIITKSGVASRAAHANTGATGGATIKVVIPSPTDISGGAQFWNALMIHNGGQAAPIFRVDGLGNVESTGTFKVKGQEVYHPGNPMTAGDFNARTLTNNVFDSNQGNTPLVVQRQATSSGGEYISIQVEDAVSRIVHQNDEAASSMIFTIKNLDKSGNGVKTNTHDLVFEGSGTGSKLSLDGNEVYHKGNLTLPDTSDFLSKTTGGYIKGTLGIGEGITVPNQPVYHQLNITRPLDAALADSGIVRIESKDDIEFGGNQQSLFKIVNSVAKTKNAISVYRGISERTFNVNTDGYVTARNVNTIGMTLYGAQGGVAMGSNTVTAGQEWFWMAPYIKGTDGTTNADFGKELGYQVAPNTWYCEPKFTISDDLLVGCTDSTRPKIAGFVNHKATVVAGANQNGMLIKTSHSSPSTLTLLHDTNANTGTMLRILSDVALSPNAGAIATYPNPTATQQGTPSFQLQMDGDLTTSGRINIGAMTIPTQDRVKVTATDDVFAISVANTRTTDNSNGIQVSVANATSNLYTGIFNGVTNFRVNADGQIGTNAGIRMLGSLGINFVQADILPKTGAGGQGSGIAFEPGNTNTCTMRFDSDKFRIWAPDGKAAESGSPMLQLNRLTRSVYTSAGLYAQSFITPITDATVGGWARGHVIKDKSQIGDEEWSTGIRAMSGFTGTNGATTSFFVGFGDQAWNTASPTSAMQVYPNGNVLSRGTFGTFSDARLKKNIESASPKLASMLKVNVVNYVMKNDINETKQLGVIAQELETIFPSLVDQDADGTKYVKYSVFTPMLIKSVQELHALTVTQDAKIDSMQREMDELKASLAAVLKKLNM